MKRSTSSASAEFKVPPHSPHLSLSGIPGVTEGSDSIELPLMEKKSSSPKSIWSSADAADLFILLCSFLLIAISIALVAIVLYSQGSASVLISPALSKALSTLQRVISTLAVAVASAVIMVAGKRYVLLKLARGGLRSRGVAVYSNASIGNLIIYLLLHRVELPLLGFSAVWGLALATGLTVNDSWEMGSASNMANIAVPNGPLDPAIPGSSWLAPASEQLNYVLSSLCFGTASLAGLVAITDTNTGTDLPTMTIYYPPLPYSIENMGFSFSTTMNGFNISEETLPSVPSTAQNLTCLPSNITTFELWSDSSDNQTLSIIVAEQYYGIYRFNATPILIGGTLSSNGNSAEFVPNGTSWPNVTPTSNQWALDITSLLCNTSSPTVCLGSSFSDAISGLNALSGLNPEASTVADEPYSQWSTMLNMALGAYTFTMFPSTGERVPNVMVTQYGVQFTPRYEIYILVANIVVSVIMLIVVVKLRRASRLGPDFINPTRLLLDPLKKPELFNASLKTTVDAFSDPYMLVREDDTFVLSERESTGGRGRWTKGFALPEKHWDHETRSVEPLDDDETLAEV